MKHITKNVFIDYLSCPVLGWFAKRGVLPKKEDSHGELLYFESKNVRKLAGELFLNSADAYRAKIEEAALYTEKLLENSEIKTIREASFIAEHYFARTDIIQKTENNTWELFGVKLGNKYKAKYIADLAFNAFVMKKAGVEINKFTLLLLSQEGRLGMEASKLFKTFDITEKALAKTDEFLNISKTVVESINCEEKPKPQLKINCKNCPAFENCFGERANKHIFNLPLLSMKVVKDLIALDIDTVDKIPQDFELTEIQQIAKNCILTDEIFISDNLKSELQQIKPPFYYLDFESVSSIIPLYPDTPPHSHILTQFSIDKTDENGKILDHYEYIADCKRKCEREIAEKLVEYLGHDGNIMTYSNSEKLSILSISGIFTDLSELLKSLTERIVDLEALIKKNYYDSKFLGHSSIKKVLPVLAPEMDYLDLEIAQGGDACASFAFMAMGLYDSQKVEETKKNLLAYCQRDTLAMIKIHQFLLKTVSLKK